MPDNGGAVQTHSATENKQKDIRTDHLPTLDGLRGLAALVVVVSHSANAGFLPVFLGSGLGQMGVGLFYALSGFLISYLYADRPMTATTIGKYSLARLSRVLPLYYFVVILSLIALTIFGIAFYGYSDFSGFLINALLIRGSSVLWSIPVEIHYYVLFLGVWSLTSRSRWILSFCLLLLLQLGGVLFMNWIDGWRTSLPFWLHFFLFGHFLAFIFRRYRDQFLSLSDSRILIACSILFVAALVISPPQVRRDLGWIVLPQYMDPVSVGVPLLMFLFALISAGPFSSLASPPLAFLGKISFSVYLIHMPVIIMVGRICSGLNTFPGFEFVLIFVVTLSMSTGTYFIIERSAQNWLRRPKRGK